MNNWVEFELLKVYKGKAYQDQRDRLLNTTSELDTHLNSLMQDINWKNRIFAYILKGWSKNRDLFEKVLKDLDEIDVEHEQKTVSGIAGVYNYYARRAISEFHEDILPLCWEGILAFYQDLPEWKIIVFLRMIQALPQEESVEPVLELLQSSYNNALREAAGKTLIHLPKNAVGEKVYEEMDKHKHICEILDSVISKTK